MKTMNSFKMLTLLLCLAFLTTVFNHCHGQLVVNGKNLNADNNLEYIQLMYYIDKASIKPVFFIDYGFIEPEYNDILLDEQRDYQTISINGQEVTERVTVVWVLNRMNQAGWEYLGDVVFVPLKVMNNWHIYTLRRKHEKTGGAVVRGEL